MGVGLVVFRRIEVHDAIDTVNVDAACGYIGSDECLRLSFDEGFQRVVSLILRSAAVDGSGLYAVLLQLARDSV